MRPARIASGILANTENIKRKDRTAKTRVFNLGKNCELDSYYCCSVEDGILLVSNISRYQAPLFFAVIVSTPPAA